MKRFERICAIIVFSIVLIGAGWLGVMSLKWSQVFFAEDTNQYSGLYIPRVQDHIKNNIAVCIILFVLLGMTAFLAEKWLNKKHIVFLGGIESIILFVFCCLYIVQMQALPVADSNNIIMLGAELAKGNNALFEKGSYLSLYPHQAGISWFISILINMFPQQDIAFVFQIVNSICVAGMPLAGYYVVDGIWNRKSVDIVFMCLQGMCLPFIFYSAFVYGETIHLFLVMVFLGQMVKILHEGGHVPCGRCIIATLSLALAICVRRNTLVIVVAIVIVALIILLCEKKKIAFVILLSTIIACCIAAVLPRAVFKENYTEKYAYPSISWVYIGMLDGGGFGYGCYDGTALQMFEEIDFDNEVAQEVFTKGVSEQLSDFIQNPKQMFTFYKEKILWQWLAPSYQCFDSNRFHKEGYPQNLAYEISYGKYREKVFNFMDSYQSFSYITFILGALLLLKRHENFIGWIWAIIFIGGVLFSILWEASPRYVYPYMVLIIPCCAYGIAEMTEQIKNLLPIKLRNVKNRKR